MQVPRFAWHSGKKKKAGGKKGRKKEKKGEERRRTSWKMRKKAGRKGMDD